jgi:hypothetical protein
MCKKDSKEEELQLCIATKYIIGLVWWLPPSVEHGHRHDHGCQHLEGQSFLTQQRCQCHFEAYE